MFPIRRFVLASLAAATALSAPAWSQTASTSTETTEPAAADGTNANEIVVTAQRREQRLQDVPIAVTPFTGELLNQLATRDVADIFQFAPNVAFTSGPTGGDDGGFFIRGVGQLDNSIAVDPGVGVYIDEIYIARLQASSISLLDIERIEVLRGPQGTLFGRNTIGGAVSIITANPKTDGFRANLNVIGGIRNRIDVAGSINVPLSSRAAVRLSVFTRNQDGQGRNVYNPRNTFGDVHDTGGRIKLLWEPVDELTIQLSGDYIRGRGSPAHQLLLGFNPQAGIVVPRPPQAGGPFFRPGVSPTGVPFPVGVAQDVSTDRFANFFSIPARLDSENGGVSGNITFKSGNITIRSITGYREYIEDSFNDFDATGFILYDQQTRLKQRQFSQELQVAGDLFDDRLSFLVGGYYFTENLFTSISLCTGSNAPRLVNRCLRSRNQIGLESESGAAFGQLEFKFTDTLSAFAGIRHTSETKRQNFTSSLDNTLGAPTVLPPIAIPPPGTARVVLPFTRVRATFEATNPRVGVNWQPKRNLTFYASYAEGFKSGGFTGRPSNQQVVAYDPETVQTFEAGFKTELFDRKLRLNGAAFTSDYKQIQLLVFTPVSGLFDTENAGDASIDGFELEADASIGRRITFRGTLGYLHGRYDRLNPNVAGVQLTDRLPLTPEWTYSLGGQYTLPVGERGSLAFRADWNYRSTVSYQIENDPLEIEPGFGILNLRLTYAPSEKFDIALIGTNVLDEVFFQQRQDSTIGNGAASGVLGDPAEWAIQARLRF